MQTFTKGPWIVGDRDVNDNQLVIMTGEGTPVWIAKVFPKPHYHPDEQRANARLIAAAPALYEALQACVDKLAMWPEGSNPEFFPCVKAGRAALRLADGKE